MMRSDYAKSDDAALLRYRDAALRRDDINDCYMR